MLIGTLAMKDQVAYTPWFGRGNDGDSAYFVLDVIDKTTNGNVDVTVYHRNTEDTDHGSAATSALNYTTTGVKGVLMEGLKEQYRFKIEGKGTSASDWCTVAFYAPIAYTNKT